MSIARTPEDYILTAIDRIRDRGSKITDFSDGGGARSIIEALAAMLAQQSQVAEQLRLDSYLATATGDALTAKALDFRVQRKDAFPARGTVTIVRAAGGTAVNIPAGWTTLQTIPVPGLPTQSFVTTEAAVFASADLTMTVAAVAVEGGVLGNIAAGTTLLPVDPVAGFQTQGGFAVGAAFTGGVDAESDDALRARVPIEVQGRVKGRMESFLAAALRVSGVESANVLRAGDLRGDGSTVETGLVEVYYEGDAALLSQVASEVSTAATALQSPSTTHATADRLVAILTVFAPAGVDTAALALAVKTAIITPVNACGVGVDVKQSTLVKAVHGVADVLSMTVPFTDLRHFADASGTHGDVVIKPERYASLDPADITVTVTTV